MAKLKNPLRVQLAKLMDDWKSDPCYDLLGALEEQPELEPFREELAAFAKAQEEKWAKRYQDRLQAYADRLGCPNNLVFAAYVRKLEERITKLEDRNNQE